MKAPAIMLLAASCLLLDGGYAASVQVVTLEGAITKGIGDRIKEALEVLKEQMKTGNPKLGIPVLEPVNIKSQKINVEDEKFNIQGSIADVHVQGLSDFTVQFADLKIGKWNLTIDMLWSNIKGKLLYDLDGLVLNKIPIYGSGEVDFEVKGFRFASQIKLKMNRKENKMSILNFNHTEIGLDSIRVGITGLFNDNELSEMISAIISENTPSVIKDFQAEIIAEVDKLALKVGNEVLEQVPLDEITGIVNKPKDP